MTGAKSRTKGQTGERQLAQRLRDITGLDIRRRVRQHDGDADLEGLDAWSIEAKRYRAATPALVNQWWRQACDQAAKVKRWPVLFYRVDRGDWRTVWPSDLHTDDAMFRSHINDTLTATPEIWWECCKHLHLTDATVMDV